MRQLAAILLLLATGTATAADYVAGPGSTLGFTATYQGEEFEGTFARFTLLISFDPAAPETGRFDVDIELASANTSNAERDELLTGGDFFDTATQPRARYRATSFRSLGGNRFVAEGTLSLRGISRTVPLTFTWTPGATPVLAGEASLSRLAFRVGTGDWTDTGLLPDTVKVKTRLVLAPATTTPPL